MCELFSFMCLAKPSLQWSYQVNILQHFNKIPPYFSFKLHGFRYFFYLEELRSAEMNIYFFSLGTINEAKPCLVKFLFMILQASVQDITKLLLFLQRQCMDRQHIILVIRSDHRSIQKALNLLNSRFFLTVQDFIYIWKLTFFDQIEVEISFFACYKL